MRYALWMKQAGEGCDYTIGCWQRLVELANTDLEKAHEEALQVIRDFTNSETTIEEARIVETRLLLSEEAKSRIALEIVEAKAAEDRKAKMQQFEQLKKELGV